MYPDAADPIPQRISRADEKRRAVAEARGIDAYRVINGPADGGPAGLTLDRYARWLVLTTRAEDVQEAWANASLDALDADGLVLKTAKTPPASRLYRGELPKEPIAVREEGATFLCDLDSGLSTGLFLDHREARIAARAHSKDQEVLNLFAYTGAFSVHAALGGARRVTSVDAMKRALERGRENMKRSGLDPDRHRWFPDDVLEHVARQRRRGPAYGLVIADPPVVGRAKGATFSLERDLERLAEGCVGSVVPGGVVMLATHAIDVGEARLLDALERAAEGRAIEVLARLGLPDWDHPVVKGKSDLKDRGDYLKTLVVRVA
jgi:23S rRNA (cytosine1962-C5)-methyltransferase